MCETALVEWNPMRALCTVDLRAAFAPEPVEENNSAELTRFMTGNSDFSSKGMVVPPENEGN